MELIPGLPNDVAIECLIRVPFSQISKAASVSKNWKAEIQLPEFRQRRKAAGFTQPLIAMTRADINLNEHIRDDDDGGARRLHHYLLKICDPERRFWYEVPSIPGFSKGVPMFCQVAGVGTNLVVIGGYDPVSWKTLNSVFIYDFLTATWRDGAAMPGGQRSFFGSASDGDHRILVAGGHDGNKNALASAMMYDVAKNEWVVLRDMARERDECKCIFHRGRFHVVGGYCTDRQGDFESSAEALELDDVDGWKWDELENIHEMDLALTKIEVPGGHSDTVHVQSCCYLEV
ncbi:unnamed protein product [Coffea canephora]|uniref:F-box domain-containing protein n=1 Tax=Coffea canephora TaxID=49390 RepID=A0A068UN04_COFCA|nr:unnamed protein product [Coffea canephora]